VACESHTLTCKEREMIPLILARRFREAHVLLYLGMSFLSDVVCRGWNKCSWLIRLARCGFCSGVARVPRMCVEPCIYIEGMCGYLEDAIDPNDDRSR
jgi:hypothetical protein